MKSRARSKRHGLKVDQHHVGYLLKIGDTRALTGQHGYEKALVKTQRPSSMIGANQGVHLVGGERYASTIKGNQARI
jgi:hypothetical protein